MLTASKLQRILRSIWCMAVYNLLCVMSLTCPTDVRSLSQMEISDDRAEHDRRQKRAERDFALSPVPDRLACRRQTTAALETRSALETTSGVNYLRPCALYCCHATESFDFSIVTFRSTEKFGFHLWKHYTDRDFTEGRQNSPQGSQPTDRPKHSAFSQTGYITYKLDRKGARKTKQTRL